MSSLAAFTLSPLKRSKSPGTTRIVKFITKRSQRSIGSFSNLCQQVPRQVHWYFKVCKSMSDRYQVRKVSTWGFEFTHGTYFVSTKCFHVPEQIGNHHPKFTIQYLKSWRLQTGMRGAYGKPNGTVARVYIGQILLSIRIKEANKQHAVEALRRAKFKFPGKQKIIVSNKWGFTPFSKEEYQKLRAEEKIIPDGAYCKFATSHGPLNA